MTDLPADTLRAAAEKLRPSSPVVAAHTVAVKISPAAADSLAAWLEKIAKFCDDVEDVHGRPISETNSSVVDALAVACAINGSGT